MEEENDQNPNQNPSPFGIRMVDLSRLPPTKISMEEIDAACEAVINNTEALMTAQQKVTETEHPDLTETEQTVMDAIQKIQLHCASILKKKGMKIVPMISVIGDSNYFITIYGMDSLVKKEMAELLIDQNGLLTYIPTEKGKAERNSISPILINHFNVPLA